MSRYVNNRSRLYSKSLSHFPMCSVKGSFVIAFISCVKKDKRQNVDLKNVENQSYFIKEIEKQTLIERQ